MMATSMGPGFPGHAAMNHPGMAVGHPMAPGMPQNAGQQGAPGGGMPHQFGGQVAVSGPGGQVNPAMMGGMPPGANPNAHAIQHLSPAQQQMFQQQQQQLQGQFHPSMAAAMRQQQALLQQQQQQRQALLAQQAFQNNMQAGMPMGLQMNAQQVQQMHHMRQQAGRLGPGQHPQIQQQMLAQQLALQQQQQAQHQQQQQQHAQQQHVQGQPQQGGPNPQMAGGPNPGQPMHPGMANMQQQGQMAGQQGPQGQQPQGQPGQPQGQPQQQQGQPQPQQPGQQPQGQQQTSQAGTPANTGGQTPSQTPAPTPAQPNHPSQQQGQQQPPQQHPQGHPQQMQGHPQQIGTQQMTAQQQMNAQQMASLMQQQQQHQRREGMKGQCLLKLMQFGEHLSGFPGPKGKDDISYWTTFVYRFFSPNGVFRHSLHVADGEDSTDKQYEIAFPAIARYFHTHFESGVRNMQLIMDKGITDRPLPGDCHFIENSKASIVYWFETGSHLVANGTLRAQFDAEQKLELLEFITTSNEEYVARRQVIDAAKPAHVWMKEWHKLNSSDAKGSPEMSKKGKAKQLKSPQSHPPEVLSDIPDSAVNSKGVTAAVHQFLEIVEVMGQMNPLFNYCYSNPELGPYSALEQYVSTQINGVQPQVNGQMQQAPRTPSFGQFQMGASPAAAHMALPGAGSPHVSASPIPGQMQAPPMQMQQSQQGTSSSGPSANTSPASNKRRRPSTVKVEDDGSGAPTPAGTGAQVNGRGTKPPTPRMNKRAKVNQQS